MEPLMAFEPGFDKDDLKQMVLRLAHEIRNPLATIKSAVQLLEHIQKPEGEIAEFYDSIEIEVERIDRVIKDMQRYVRLDSNSATMITIEHAIQTSVEAEANTAHALRSVVVVEGGPDVSVLMDQTQLEDALRELLNNAIKFSPPESTIRISWHDQPANAVAIDIDDQGPGISDYDQAQILRPFFSTSTQGTGLGLNIVNLTCRLVGGDFSWRNLESGGSRFTMVLPRLP